MRKLVALLVAATACGLLVISVSSAAVKAKGASGSVWTAALTSGQEVPVQAVKATSAHGMFKGTLSGTTLKWTLTYSKLTGPPKSAQLAMAAKGATGPAVIVLCGGPCTSGSSGAATVSKTVVNAFKKHLLYVTIPTAKNPKGEIRGQVAAG